MPTNTVPEMKETKIEADIGILYIVFDISCEEFHFRFGLAKHSKCWSWNIQVSRRM